jgi:hypothetical protein
MVALNNERRGLSTLFAVCDATILLLAAVAAVRIRFGPDFFADQLQIVIEHPGFAAYAIVGLWFLGTTFELYRPAVWRTLDALVVRILALAVIFPTALVLGVYLVPEWRFGRGLLVLTLVIAVPSLALVRMLWFAWGPAPPGATRSPHRGRSHRGGPPAGTRTPALAALCHRPALGRHRRHEPTGGSQRRGRPR